MELDTRRQVLYYVEAFRRYLKGMEQCELTMIGPSICWRETRRIKGRKLWYKGKSERKNVMTLQEVRAGIDAVDTQMKPLFLKRMECGKHVAEVKGQTGGDVFVREREMEIIEKRAGDVDPVIQSEYKMFLRHLMSLCRKYEYELLPEMQEKVITTSLKLAGLNADEEHSQVKIAFTCQKETSDLNLFLNMAKLNNISIDSLNLKTEDGVQKIIMILDGKITDSDMRCLLCQVGKEAEDFVICDLIH